MNASRRLAVTAPVALALGVLVSSLTYFVTLTSPVPSDQYTYCGSVDLVKHGFPLSYTQSIKLGFILDDFPPCDVVELPDEDKTNSLNFIADTVLFTLLAFAALQFGTAMFARKKKSKISRTKV